MIVVLHKNNQITSIFSKENATITFDKNKTIAEGILDIALRFQESKIVWCHENAKEQLDLEVIESFFHHNKMLFSYNPNENSYLGTKIGYVEDTPFIKINKKVQYPTWQMSSLVGAIHASVLLEIKCKIKLDSNFDYYLNSIAKVCMPLGLLCYSEPKLLRESETKISIDPASTFTLFKFVKQHYKARWVFLLFLNLMIYEHKFLIAALIYSFFYKNRNQKNIFLDAIAVSSSLKVVNENTVDVIIPTIGRKKHLYDVLQDLAQQTHLPQNVIIVEQNPLENSVSELDYLQKETWPFVINHNFTHQAGACNARNIALGHAKSEWVFLADDDIRIDPNFIFETLKTVKKTGATAVTLRCYLREEKKVFHSIFQWTTFGSGCSFVKSDNLKELKFNTSFEFGFGEDADFGMQLRNQGCDILYLPEPSILHLKAPMGGFRSKSILKWQNDKIQPKPSPTVVLFKLLHLSSEQLFGYKTMLFFKFYKVQKIKNPLGYYKNFQKQWKQSLFWANELKK
jgi:GT2 family glycosyltransferase